jgi:hypothetical protein
MAEPQFFPMSPGMMALVSETVSRRVSRLPFERNGVLVTEDLIRVTMECLNAEFKKALPLKTTGVPHQHQVTGLDHCIEDRVSGSGKTVVPVIAEVLCSAGIAETTDIIDRYCHRSMRGIRLLSAWCWHMASPPVPVVEGSGDAPENSSWTNLCAVCRTGILTRVTGKQLFGIPRTDFYWECTYCGAKFIPVGTQFRLVSIGTIRDPLWKKHLDQTYPPETWSLIARGTGQSSGPFRTAPVKKTALFPADPGGLTHMKDGTLMVPCGEKTRYFKPARLHFSGGLKENVFARAQKPLNEILQNPVFSHLISPVHARYSRYLPLKSGLFLNQLKERHDPFYREFLNNHGDEKYGSFRLEGSPELDKKGILIVLYNRELYHVVNCSGSIRAFINETIGRISPEKCFLSGNSTACRINALLSSSRKDAGIFAYTCEPEEERISITEILQAGISPARNLHDR